MLQGGLSHEKNEAESRQRWRAREEKMQPDHLSLTATYTNAAPPSSLLKWQLSPFQRGVGKNIFTLPFTKDFTLAGAVYPKLGLTQIPFFKRNQLGEVS